LTFYTLGIIAVGLHWVFAGSSEPHFLSNKIALWLVTGIVLLFSIGMMIVHMIPDLQDRGVPVDRSIRLAPVFGSMGVGVLWSLILWVFERRESSETWLQRLLGVVLEVEFGDLDEGQARLVTYTQVSAILLL
jgi:hypothetical protein